MIYLGYQIIGSFKKISEVDTKPIRFFEAAMFQIINPKAWTISSMVASGFLSENGNMNFTILVIAITALIICPLSISPWALFGPAIKGFIDNKWVRILIEYFLSITLLMTAIMILIG
tara:strand:- start:316 stop:666 length:351 start_codon:yes stop_codon:yes gene_type:complete